MHPIFQLDHEYCHQHINGVGYKITMSYSKRWIIRLLYRVFCIDIVQRIWNLHVHWLVYTHENANHYHYVFTTCWRSKLPIYEPPYCTSNNIFPHGNTHFKKGFSSCCDGFFQVLVLFIYIFKRPKQNACVPIVANCPIFKTCFTNEHLLKQITTKLATSICIQPKTLNPIEIENFINALNLLPFLDAKSHTFKMNSIVLTLTLLRY